MKTDKCSERLKYALKLRNIKQAELSKLSDIPKSAISQYASGKFEPKQDRIETISKILNVSEAWLMGYNVPMSREIYNNSDLSNYSDNTNTIKLAGRDGSYIERKLTDDQLDLIKKMIDQMPDAEDL